MRASPSAASASSASAAACGRSSSGTTTSCAGGTTCRDRASSAASAFHAVGGYPDLRGAEDWGLWLEVSRRRVAGRRVRDDVEMAADGRVAQRRAHLGRLARLRGRGAARLHGRGDRDRARARGRRPVPRGGRRCTTSRGTAGRSTSGSSTRRAERAARHRSRDAADLEGFAGLHVVRAADRAAAYTWVARHVDADLIAFLGPDAQPAAGGGLIGDLVAALDWTAPGVDPSGDLTCALVRREALRGRVFDVASPERAFARALRDEGRPLLAPVSARASRPRVPSDVA